MKLKKIRYERDNYLNEVARKRKMLSIKPSSTKKFQRRSQYNKAGVQIYFCLYGCCRSRKATAVHPQRILRAKLKAALIREVKEC